MYMLYENTNGDYSYLNADGSVTSGNWRTGEVLTLAEDGTVLKDLRNCTVGVLEKL